MFNGKSAKYSFLSMKYFCPPTYNPAEFYVNVLAHADTDELNEMVSRSARIILSATTIDCPSNPFRISNKKET